jgi:hypothetical protein
MRPLKRSRMTFPDGTRRSTLLRNIDLRRPVIRQNPRIFMQMRHDPLGALRTGALSVWASSNRARKMSRSVCCLPSAQLSFAAKKIWKQPLNCHFGRFDAGPLA